MNSPAPMSMKPKSEERPADYKVKPARSFFDRIPFAVKALFIKYWFFAAIYFFIAFGLGEFIGSDGYLLALILGIAVGFVNDFIVYNILNTLESDRREAHYYEYFKSKKLYSLLINLPIAIVWSYATAYICSAINSLFLGSMTVNWICAEPFTYGLVALIVDGVLIFIKNIGVLAFRRLLNKEVS